jgi:hypothetical protein
VPFKLPKRWLVLLSLVSVCAIGAAGVIWRERVARSRSMEELRQFETSLKRAVDELPLGSDRSRVEDFLTKHQVEHTYYPRSSSDRERIPATLDAYTHYVGTASLRCKLHFTFKFDDENKLAGYEDKYVCAP